MSFARTLSFRSALAIVVGGVIGSGVFMKPALMASQLGSPLLMLSVWIVAGIITLFGALSNAEVAAMFPETGGQYVFFKEMYGAGFAFVYGWAAFAVFNTAGNASIAYVCAQYANYFISLPRLSPETESAFIVHIPYAGDLYPLKEIGLKMCTMLLIVLLTVINYYSVQYGALLQRLLTGLKALAIIILIGGIFLSGKGAIENITHNGSFMPSGTGLLGAYIAAIAGAFWAYDGWNNISFVAGEIQSPQKNIPRSLLTGLLFCIVVYALLNLAYSYVLPVELMSLSGFVASDAAAMVWGGIGGSAIALMVILSTFGTTNANVLSTARVTYAWSAENSLFAWAGTEHKRYHTPGRALLLNACWSCLLILSGSFDMLTDMLIFVTWFFYGMSALGVFVLRRRMKNRERPYRVTGYPFVPAVFVLFTAFFLGSTLYFDISAYLQHRTVLINSVFGLMITCIGIPLYYFSGRKHSR